MPGRCGTLALHLCFTVSHLSCCIFTTRTAEGRRRRKPVLGCQRAPGTSSGRFVFEQEASLLQPGQAPPYGPLGAPLGEEGPCEASHPMAGGRGGEGLSAVTQGRLLQARRGKAALSTAAIASLPALCSRRNSQSWKACKGLRHCQKSLAFIKSLLGAQPFQESTSPWWVLEM